MMLAQALPIANALLSGRDFEICTILPSSYGIVPETAAKVFHPAFTEKIKCFRLKLASAVPPVDKYSPYQQLILSRSCQHALYLNAMARDARNEAI